MSSDPHSVPAEDPPDPPAVGPPPAPCERVKRYYSLYVVQNWDHLVRLAERRVGNKHDAEEVVQQSLLQVFTRLADIDPNGNLGGLVYRVVICRCTDVHRKRSRQPRTCDLSAAADPPSADLSPVDIAEANETLARIAADIAAATAGLPERDRDVLNMHHDGMTNTDIATLFSVSNSLAAQWLCRAKAKLAAVLNTPSEGDTDPTPHHLNEEK